MLRRLIIKITYLIFVLQIEACSVEDEINAQMLRVRILGGFEQPPQASGQYEPITQTYQIEQINLIGSDNATINLYTDSPISARISNRPLLIFEKQLSENFIGLAFNQLQIIVNKEVKATSKYNKNHTLTLETNEIFYSSPFIVPKGQSLVFTIIVQWRSTVSRDEGAKTDVMSLPTFRVTLEKS